MAFDRSQSALVLATENQHKIAEFAGLLRGQITLVTMGDAGFQEGLPEEGRVSYEINASEKARSVGYRLKRHVIGDDSGFEVEALHFQPGILSARYGMRGDQKISAAEQRRLLLEELSIHSNRRARFVSVLAFYDPLQDQVRHFRGEIWGSVLKEEKGRGGFGYDALFVPEGFSKTFAEMSDDEKNAISHRARAAQLFLTWLTEQDKT